MSIGLIGWGRFLDANGGKITIPAPSSTPPAPWLWDFLRSLAPELGVGFDYVQLPPASLTQSGTAATGDGYGIVQRRMFDGTRYGSTEGLMAMVAALKANGVKPIGDLVLHQFAQISRSYPGGARGAQTEGWFRGQCSWNAETKAWNDPIPPYCQADDVPVLADDFAFGAEISYQHCNPPGVTEADAIDFLNYMSQLFGITDYRYDDTKGQHAPSVRRIMDSLVNGTFYSEYFDGNPTNLNWWATSSPMNGRSGVEDFTLHWRIQAACNGFDASQVDQGGAGYWQWRPDLAIAFVDNPDTDTSPGQQVVFNKGLAYAYMLMLPCRMALVYGKDYFPSSVWPGAYGLKPIIDNLCWISQMFAIGKYAVQYVDKDVHISTRDGNGGAMGWSGGLLTGLNFNVLSPRTIVLNNSQHPFGPNAWLHDYAGHGPDISTDENGQLEVTIPSNAWSNGQSFVQYARGGVNKPNPSTTLTTTQTFISAIDLPIKPMKNGMTTLPQRLYCLEGSNIQAKFTFRRIGIAADATVQVEIVSSTGSIVGWASTGPSSVAIASSKAANTGWYTLRLVGNLLPDAGVNFNLQCTYKGAV